MIPRLRNHSLRKLIYYLRYTEFTALARMIEQKLIAPKKPFHCQSSRDKFCLFISGCPGDSYRYRCEHQAAQLESLGLRAEICYDSQIKDPALIDSYQCLWLQRVFNSVNMESIIQRARRSGKPILFDIDDLVFDEDVVPCMREINWMSKREIERVYERAKGYREIMSRCDIITVPTDELRKAVLKIFPRVSCIVTPNMLDDAQLALARKALGLVERQPRANPSAVTIAYFSGTHTHNADFKECATALIRIMTVHPSVRLMLVGYLDIGQEFAALNGRIESRRLVRWERLPDLYTQVDINLAPLETANPFTACKSDLKYFEAAIMRVPTVASDVGAYAESMKYGDNGYLCRTSEDWFGYLSLLIEDSELRHRIGNRAREIVLQSRTINVGAERLSKTVLKEVATFNSRNGIPGQETEP